MLKLNKFFLPVIILCFLSVPFSVAQTENTVKVNVPTEESVVQNDENKNMELVQNNVKLDDPDIEPIDTKDIKKTVIPDTQKEGKKVLMLFVKAMFIVFLCSIVLYFILSFVKKFYGNSFSPNDIEEFESLDLASPNSKDDALKSFLNRTK